MGLFETANELVVLDGFRRVEWSTQKPTATKPTSSVDGSDVSDAIAGAVNVEPTSGAFPMFDIWGYIGLTENGPGSWTPIERDIPTDGVETSYLLRDIGEYDRLAVVGAGIDSVIIGEGILE